MKGKLTTTQTLTARQAIAGGGSSPSGPVTWSQIQNKPFSTVDTENGLAIYDNVLMIDTLDKIATIDYVDQEISDIGWNDVQDKPFNTVGAGLEVNNGSLKEVVPLYEEHSSEEQTSTAEAYPYRQGITHYTDTFIWYEDRRLPMISNAASIPQFEFSYEYDDGGIPVSPSYSSSSLTPSDFLNGFSATDSAGNQWAVSLHGDQLQFVKGSNVETYELSVSIEIVMGEEERYGVSGTANRESWSEYTDSFIYSDDILISFLLGASDVTMEFTYWDGSQDQTLYVNHLDLTDTSSDYEQDGLHWNIYADEWSIYFNCTNGLPSDTGTSATVQFTYIHTVETTTVHKLPAKYVPIDNNTIQVDWNGNLYANVPPSGVQSVSYSNMISEGTTVGYLNVDYNSYEILVPAGGTSTVGWDDIQNKPTFATVATSGDYDDLANKPTIPTVPSNVSAFTNDAGYITDSALTPYVQASALTTVAYSGDYNDLDNLPTIPTQTSVTVTQTLSTGTAIADIDVDGVTTTLYAPAGGGGGGSQADWAETDSTADSYILNKPPIIKGSNNRGIILSTNSNYKVATGTGSIASGYIANSAFSDSILATGIGAVAFGNIQGGSQQVNASGVASTAKGQTNRSGKITASGIGSVAIGSAEYYSITASGQGSVAIGYTDDTTVSREIKATAANSFAFGSGAQATKSNSFAFGRYVSANGLNQMAVGKYNVVDSSNKYNFIVGNGASSSALSNSFATGADGNVYVKGDIYANVSDFTDPTNNGVKLATIPAPPTTDGTYTLQAAVSNGTITYSWI